MNNLDLGVALEPADGRLVVVDGALDGQVPLDHLLRLFRQRFRELVLGVSLCADDANGFIDFDLSNQSKEKLSLRLSHMGTG